MIIAIKYSYLVLLLAIITGFADNLAFGKGTAVASLGQIRGFVEVTPNKDQKKVTGKNGLLLYVGDIIQTNQGSVVTMFFRDGSEIRLFENSELMIEQAEEQAETKERSFQYKLSMKLGALWGKFVRGRQKTQIITSNATIKIEGTVFRVSDDGTSVGVSVVEGSVVIKNESSSVILEAGQRIPSFQKEDQLISKIENIPYQIELKSDKYQLNLIERKEGSVRFTIQIIDINQTRSVRRTGRIHLQSNYYNIKFPDPVLLEANGIARISVKIKPPHIDDTEFDGKIIIWAAMDNAHSDDIGAGNLLLKIRIPPKKTQIRIDANSGKFLPAQ